MPSQDEIREVIGPTYQPDAVMNFAKRFAGPEEASVLSHVALEADNAI